MVIFMMAGRGIVVFSACSHAGIDNVCQHAASCEAAADLPQSHIILVVGGLHLAGRDGESRISETVEALQFVLEPGQG
jgi:7,8-dihydropterin-6-yl-methyl-4-(beta-D-ribofuranosyl)aminobenzene 5'-phosphate synthase